MMNFLKPLQQALFFCFLAVLPVHAQEIEIQGVTQSGGNPVVETFDGEDLSTILGGQLRQTHNTSPWLVYLADGKLVMENRQNPNSLHYNDISWVKYPNSTVVDTTQNAVISAVVEGRASSTGGAGILIGSGKAGAYIAFLVDQSGRYHLLQKDGRQLRTVITELNSAIRTDQPNELSFEVRGANLAFLVNGEDVIQIESPNRMPGSRRIDGRTGVGLAAFGIGTFGIESVEISKGN